MIRRLGAGEVRGPAERLLAGFRFHPLFTLRQVAPERIRAHLLAEIASSIEQGAACFLAGADDAPRGMVVAGMLDFDTRHFSLPMAQIGFFLLPEAPYDAAREAGAALLSALEEWAIEKGVRILVAKIGAEHLAATHALEEAGYLLMEAQNFFALDLTKRDLLPEPEIAVRWARPEDLARCREIAGTVYAIDRFHRDPWIPRDRADALYTALVENAFADPARWNNLVAEADGRVVAFRVNRKLLYRESLGVNILGGGNLGVDRAWQARGVGHQVLIAEIKHFSDGFDVQHSSAFAHNYGSLNMIAKLGHYAFCYSFLTFHRHVPGGRP